VSGPTALDLFCGAGGSSTGLVAAGLRVVLAANHWPLAVAVHQTNHPDTDHDCADLAAVDPRRYPATDLLWASPECTNHSVAKGRRRHTGQGVLFGADGTDPAAERSRATMWDVPRFAEAMAARGAPYAGVIVENVVDARWWVGWNGWITTMTDLGYQHAMVYLNSAFAHGKDYTGAPQYRDRLYVVFWRRGLPTPDLDIRPPAWCPACETQVDAVQWWKDPARRWGRWRAQYLYRCPGCHGVAEPLAVPAAAVIDWTDLGPTIADRPRPLATATRERIRAGLARYGRPIGLPTGGNTFERHPGVRAWPVDRPRPVITATGEANALAVPPLLVPAGGTWNDDAAPADVPLRTQTTRHETALASPDRALLLPYYGTGVAHPASWPAGTVTTRDRHAVLTPPRQPADVPDNEVDACRFRMLTVAEIGAAMAFPTDYAMTGARRDRVRMYGNAVTPPAARLLTERLITTLRAT